MNGRAEVQRQRQQLDATFARASGVSGNAELLSDFARYLCILVSGFLEQAVIELAMEHVRLNSKPSIQRHVERRLRRFTTAKCARITDLFGSFDPDWHRDLTAYLVDERKDAVDSVIDLRQDIAHGRYAGGLTYVRISDYYRHIKEVVNHLADMCAPV